MKRALSRSSLYDYLIIGGGHNGLVCANYLAKMSNNQAKILVLERRGIIGGAALSEQIFPGYTFSRCSYVLSLFRNSIIKDLFHQNYQQELELIPRGVSSTTPTLEKKQVFSNLSKVLRLSSDRDWNFQEIKDQCSLRDANAFDTFEADLEHFLNAIDPIIQAIPPRTKSQYLKLLYQIYRRGNLKVSDIPELYRLITAPCKTIVDQYFDSDLMKGTLAGDSVIGQAISPNQPGSGYVLLHHVMGDINQERGRWYYVKGGNGAVSQYLAKLAEQRGVEICLSAPVDKIIVQGDEFNKEAIGVIASRCLNNGRWGRNQSQESYIELH